MNAKFSRTGSKNHPYYAISSFDEIYQLGYKHGFNDASENEDFDEDYDDEDFDEDPDYDYGEEYERENDRRGQSSRNQARDNQGRFVASNGSRRVSSKSESGTSRRGFASMSKAERTRIARMGGMASHGGGRTPSRMGFGGRRSN